MSQFEPLHVIFTYWLSRDPAGVFADDAALEDLGRGEVREGWEAIADWHETILPAALSRPRPELRRLFQCGGTVVAEWLWHGRSAQTDQAVATPIAAIYEVIDGQIQHARLYYDPARWRP